MSLVELPRLGAETIGHRLKRARERSRLTLEQAAELVSDVVPTSYGALARLEKLDALPDQPGRRFLAYLVMAAYGFDPADIDLDDEIVPRLIDRDRLRDVIAEWGDDRVWWAANPRSGRFVRSPRRPFVRLEHMAPRPLLAA